MKQRYQELPPDVAERLEQIDRELTDLDRREEELLEERADLVDPHLGDGDMI